MGSIEDIMGDQEEQEKAASKNSANSGKDIEYMTEQEQATVSDDSIDERVQIGRVEHFFDKIGVAAIHLSAGLKLGNIIEIDGQDQKLRLKVSSMQINKKDVEEADSGDSIGIKIDQQVKEGSAVYLIS